MWLWDVGWSRWTATDMKKTAVYEMKKPALMRYFITNNLVFYQKDRALMWTLTDYNILIAFITLSHGMISWKIIPMLFSMMLLPKMAFKLVCISIPQSPSFFPLFFIINPLIITALARTWLRFYDALTRTQLNLVYSGTLLSLFYFSKSIIFIYHIN